MPKTSESVAPEPDAVNDASQPAGLSRRALLGGSAAFGAFLIGSPIAGRALVQTASLRQRRAVRPAPGMPDPRMIATNGVELGVYDQGQGTPVVFCHGFPELAYSWRYQLPAVTKAGYRAIAPDQRGFGLSSRPEEIAAYSLVELCGDMAGMLDALEIERAVFVGHDWGGGVVWMMPRFYPDRVAGVVGVNTPAFHPVHQRPRQSDIVQSERFYQNTFQPPGEAEAVLERDVRKTFELLLRRGGLWDAEAFRQLPEDSLERRMDLLGMIERGAVTGELIPNEAELAYFVDTFEATGFTGGLNWYRAARSVGARMMASVKEWNISVPSLYIGAEDDVVIPPSSADGMEGYVADLEKHTIENCGHWTQQDKPEETNRLLIDWLQRKFPVA